MPPTLGTRCGGVGPPSGNLCTKAGKRRLWSRSNACGHVRRAGLRAAQLPSGRAGGSGQDEAAFDAPEPLDEDPDELDELDELEELDPESLDEEEDDEDDSDFPAFTVLLVEVLRESVR